MKRLDLVLLFLLAAIWGASFLLIRIAAPALGAIPTSALRVSIAALGLLLYAVALHNLPAFRPRWRQFLILGILNNVIPFVLLANATINLNASIAAILNATTPLFTAMVASLWLGAAFTRRIGVGILLGLLGVAVLMGWSPLPLTDQTIWATLQALIATFSYGMAAVYARKTFPGVAPLHTAIGQLCGSTVVLLTLAAPRLPTALPANNVTLAVILLALLCTSLAYLIYFHLIASAGATQAATVTFLIPFFSVLWGVIFLGEPLNAGMFAGLALILAAVWLVLKP